MVCSRPPGTRRRLCAAPSRSVPGNAFSDNTWFGSFRQGVDKKTAFGTVVAYAAPGCTAKTRRLGTAPVGDEDVVQVARDTAALLLQRLRLSNTPRTAVHVLTVAYLQKCVDTVEPARERRQVAVLVPVHLYAAVRGYLSSTPHYTFAKGVGYCTARLAGCLQDALCPTPLPPSLWLVLRTGAVALLTVRGTGAEGHADFVAGAQRWFSVSRAVVPKALCLDSSRDIMVGMAMATLHTAGSAATNLRALVAGCPGVALGRVPTQAADGGSAAAGVLAAAGPVAGAVSTSAGGPAVAGTSRAAGLRGSVLDMPRRTAVAASVGASCAALHGGGAASTSLRAGVPAAAGVSGAGGGGTGSMQRSAASPAPVVASGAAGPCTDMMPLRGAGRGTSAAGMSGSRAHMVAGCGGLDEANTGGGSASQEGPEIKPEAVDLVGTGGVRLLGQVHAPCVLCACRSVVRVRGVFVGFVDAVSCYVVRLPTCRTCRHLPHLSRSIMTLIRGRRTKEFSRTFNLALQVFDLITSSDSDSGVSPAAVAAMPPAPGASHNPDLVNLPTLAGESPSASEGAAVAAAAAACVPRVESPSRQGPNVVLDKKLVLPQMMDAALGAAIARNPHGSNV